MYQVRFATVSDAPAIAQICSEAWRVTYKNLYSHDYIEKVITDFYNLARIEQECQNSSADWHGYMVAEKAGQVLGCIGGACQDKTGLIYVFYVKPDVKGQGVGSALLDFLTAYQQETYGITRQELYATTGNQLGIPFYEKKGFKLLEIIPNWLDAGEGTKNHYGRVL